MLFISVWNSVTDHVASLLGQTIFGSFEWPYVLYTLSGVVNLGYRDELITPLTLKQELSTISHKWFEIGTYFKVQPNMLKTIKQTSETNTEVCLMKLCNEWLEEEQDATWSMVVQMLESETISEVALANSIKDRYCNSSQSPNGSPESLERSWVCILCHIIVFPHYLQS